MDNQPMQSSQPLIPDKSKNPWAIALTTLAILAILGLGYWWWQGRNTERKEEILPIDQVIAPGDDRTAAIDQALKNVTVENFDEEFQSIDSQLKTL